MREIGGRSVAETLAQNLKIMENVQQEVEDEVPHLLSALKKVNIAPQLKVEFARLKINYGSLS